MHNFFTFNHANLDTLNSVNNIDSGFGNKLNLEYHTADPEKSPFMIELNGAVVQVKAEQNLDTHELTYIVSYNPTNGGRSYTKRYRDISDLKNFMKDLCNHGIDIKEIVSEEVRKLFETVAAQVSILPLTYTHSLVGWNYFGADEDNPGFFGFGYNNAIYTYDKFIPSKYSGTALQYISQNRKQSAIAANGSLSEYLDGFRKLVVPYKKLLTVYLIGLVGILSQLLEETQYNLIVNICGETTSGKTTALLLALSAFGNPKELLHDNTMTNCGRDDLFSSYQPISCAIDETLQVSSDLSEKQVIEMIRNLIFHFHNGSTRSGSGKQKRDLLNKLSSKYYTSLLMSTERSLHALMGTEASKGQLFRMIEVKPDPNDFMRDADHVRAISQLISKHHGLIVPEFVEYMVKNGLTADVIREKVDDYYQIVTEDNRLAAVRGGSRIAQMIAPVLVVADILKACCNLEYDNADIQGVLVDSFLESVDQTQEEARMCQAAYANLCRLYAENSEKFVGNRDYNPETDLGIVNCVNNVLELSMSSHRLRMALSDYTAEEILNDMSVPGKELIDDMTQRKILKYFDENWDPSSNGNRGLRRESSKSRGLTRKIDVFYTGTHTEINGYTIKLDSSRIISGHQAVKQTA